MKLRGILVDISWDLENVAVSPSAHVTECQGSGYWDDVLNTNSDTLLTVSHV